MAKDGTRTGGHKVGGGRNPKALADKVIVGKAADAMVLPEPAEMEGVDVPPVKVFLKATQKSGIDLCAEDVFRSTCSWLKARGCEKLVNLQISISTYKMASRITTQPL